jgi:hypothetical protein
MGNDHNRFKTYAVMISYTELDEERGQVSVKKGDK